MDTRASSVVRPILVLAGAFAFAMCVSVSVHELGHAAALRYFGVRQMQIILHPFSASRVVWDATDEFLGYVDAAGPLASVLVGVVVTAALWPVRRASLLPLLFLGPIALITEGFSSTMQLAFRLGGTDMMRIVRAGVPHWLLLVLAVGLFLASIVVFCLLLPLASGSRRVGFFTRLIVLESGFALWMLIRLGYVAAFSRADLVPNCFNLVFALLVAAILAVACKPVCSLFGRACRSEPSPPDWKAAGVSVGLATVVVVSLLVFFNG